MCFHHMFPAPLKVGTLIIKTDPQERTRPRRIGRWLPLFHFSVAMLTLGYFLVGHLLLLSSVELKLSFSPISASDSNFNPRNPQCIPAVKIFALLDLNKKS